MKSSPNQLFVATRKGLFRYECEPGSSWRIVHSAFVGDNVSMVLPCRDGKTVFAALSLGADGKTLVFGSTTGNLWASDTAGDRFETLSHSLPPVAFVRFGA